MGQANTTLHDTPSDVFFLTDAALHGKRDILELFLNKNQALVCATEKTSQNTPFHFAAQSGKPDVLEILTVTLKNAAVSNTHDPFCKVINRQNALGESALMLACKKGNHACAKLLVTNGASIWQRDLSARTALHYAVSGLTIRCVKLIMAKAAQEPCPDAECAEIADPEKFVNEADVHGRTALHFGAFHGAVRASAALIQCGASICKQATKDCLDYDYPINMGATALHVAAIKGDHRMATLIMSAYATECRKSVLNEKIVVDPRKVSDAYGSVPFTLLPEEASPKLHELLHPDTVIYETLQMPEVKLDMHDKLAVAFSQFPSSVKNAVEDLRTLKEVEETGEGELMSTPFICNDNMTRDERACSEQNSQGHGESLSDICSPTDALGHNFKEFSFLGEPMDTFERNEINTPAILSESAVIVPSSLLSSHNIPTIFRCPISHSLFKEPVVAADGFTYEKSTLDDWIKRGNNWSPLTKENLSSKISFENKLLLLLMKEWRTGRCKFI